MAINHNGAKSQEFLRISELYGWKLHNYLQDRTTDPRILEELYSLIIQTFCDEYHRFGDEEQGLISVADRICAQRHLYSLSEFDDDILEIEDNARFWIVLVLLLVLIGVCLWIMLGLLMEMGLIPYVDLGHDWVLNRIRIMNWFS